MYKYLISVFTGNRTDSANNFDDGDSVTAEAEVSCAAQQKDEERRQRLQQERHHAYVDYVNGDALGQLLAPLLPRAEDISSSMRRANAGPFATDVREGRTASGDAQLTSSLHDVKERQLTSTSMESTLFSALLPLLSRPTAIVTRRVLLLSGHATLAATHESAAALASGAVAADGSVRGVTRYRLPFLFLALLLQRWQACLQDLATDLDGGASSARTLCTIHNLSTIVASLTAVTEVFAEEVHAYLEELKAVTALCAEEALRLLHLFIHGNFFTSEDSVTETSDLPHDDTRTPAEDGALAASTATHSDHVATEVVQVQVWRVLSLLLYWMHMALEAPVPHLNVLNIFLSTSAAALDPTTAPLETSGIVPSANRRGATPTHAGRVEETDRCTGLDNSALLRQTYVPPGTAASLPATWLLHAHPNESAAPAAKPLLSGTLMASTKVREILLALLLIASKGVVSDVVPNASFPEDSMKPVATTEVDHDLGFVMVLTCRLLHYSFVTCANTLSLSPVASVAEQQVRDAVSPLLSALSILLARFIAEEHVLEARKAASSHSLESGVYMNKDEEDEAEDEGARHIDAAAAFFAAGTNHNARTEGSRRRTMHHLPPVQHPRHIRLLAQLGCGILLLTTLFQQSAQTVLDTMDHSFFFDALVTALQAVGKHYLEPSAPVPPGAAVADHEEVREKPAAYAWTKWLLAVNAVSSGCTVPDTYEELAPLDAALGEALLCPIEQHFATLSDEPIVDEFLHAYLGLLSASRRLRAAPWHQTWPPDPRIHDGGSKSWPHTKPPLEVRSLDTLDQLEQTLMKTFLTAYDAADTILDVNANTLCYVEGAPRFGRASEGEEARESSEEEEEEEGAAAAKASPFPRTSCLYSLLLKHALWCLRMARQSRHPSQPQTLLLPPPTRSIPSPSLSMTSRVSSQTHQLPTLLLASPPLLVSPQPGISRSLTPTPSLCTGNSFFAPPQHAGAADLANDQQDPFLLFLVRHGLFRILLHDTHYASAFMVVSPQEVPRVRQRSGDDGRQPMPDMKRALWQRSFATLLLLSYCLQMQPRGASDSATATTVKSTAGLTAASSNSASSASTSAHPSSGTHDKTVERLTPSEELLVYETVEAITTVLRPYSHNSDTPPPPSLSSQAPLAGSEAGVADTTKGRAKSCREGTWHNCLLALLTSSLGVSSNLKRRGGAPLSTSIRESKGEAPLSSAAAAIVSEALVRCGGTEYLLQTSIASAASPTFLGARGVSFCWALCALQGLVNDPKARVHMAATCAKPLLLGALWNPLLRSSGQTLLTALLSQPLINFYTTADLSSDARDRAASKAAANGGSGGGAGVSALDSSGALGGGLTHTVPRHCRKLSEALWRALNECVNGSPPTNSAVAGAYGGTLATNSALPSAATASDADREAVLQAILAAMAEAFRILGRDPIHDVGIVEELLPLRTLQRAIFEASREGSIHIYALLLHRLAQSWRSQPSSPISPCSRTSFALPSPDTSSPVSILFSANDPLPSALACSSPPADAPPSAHNSRESVILITKVLAGLTRANPVQREVLYRNTIDEEALIDCIANAWTATVQRAARSTLGPYGVSNGSEDAAAEENELIRLCSYLVYESVDALDAFLDNWSASDAPDVHRCPHRTPAPSCAWSLQNPALLSAVLKRFLRTPLSAVQQSGLRQILRTLTHTVTVCQTSLYLAASTSLHEMLGQLLPVVALLPSNLSGAQPSRSPPLKVPTAAVAASSTRLDTMLVHLLAMLARCHIDVRQLKQLLMLVIHSRQLRERRALVPLLVQLLSSAAQPSPDAAASRGLHDRSPHHFMALHRGCGPAGFRAALPEFPLEGYSVSLYVRWEGDVSATADEESGDIPAPDLDTPFQRTHEAARDCSRCCACIFSFRTADRVTVLALMVERHTGRVFVQYRNLQQQEVRVNVAAVLPSREWSLVVLSHRPASFLTSAAGGQFQLSVDDKDAVTVPQVAYPLMSRGHLYVGCLGHEVDRMSVAHAFYGQVSTVYFFPFVLSERERETLQSTTKGLESTEQMAAATPLSTPPLRPAATSSVANRWSGANALTVGAGGVGGGGPGRSGNGGVDAGTEQWLAERATLRVDTRLSDRGHLYNLSAVLRGRGGRDSRLFTFEGTLVCSTQRVMDSMGLLGALPGVVMPLCTLLVNPTLPISFRGMVAVPQHSRDPPALPPWATVPSLHTGDGFDPSAVDSTNAAVLWVLELIPALACSDAVRNEMADSGLFVFLGQMLQLLGPSLQVVVPVALLQLLEALAPFPRLFEDVLTSLFLSSEVIHAAPRVVQLTWVSVQRSFLQAHPDALSCLRSLGTSMFVAAEVLRVTSEEESEAGDGDGKDARAAAAAFSSGSSSQPSTSTGMALCSLCDLEHQWMLYFEALTAPPVTISEAQSLQYLVENLRWTCTKPAVQLRILRRVRHLVASTTSPFFVQLLGRTNYAVSLIPYIKNSPSEAVRMEALLQFLCMAFRSRRTQELMNPVLLASRDTVVHVAEEVSLSWLKDILQQFPVNLPVYLALRCGLLGQFDVPELPTAYVPLDESHTLRFAAVLLPLLMLLKRSPDTKLKACVLTDLAVLLKSDAQAWRRVITVRGWYVSLASLFASSCTPAPASPAETSASGSGISSRAPSRSSGLLFTTTSMILSYTLFQALLHESYGATELALVGAYLREQRLHCLLHQVLCSIADRYRSRLMAQCGERRRFSISGCSSAEELGDPISAPPAFVVNDTTSNSSPRSSGGGRSGSVGLGGSIVSPGAAGSGAFYLGLGSPTALLNLCYFFRVVEIMVFYAAALPQRESLTTIPTPFSSTSSLNTTAPQSSPSEGFATPLPSRTSYTEWEELALLPIAAHSASGGGEAADAPPRTAAAARAALRRDDEAYFAAEDDDPHGNVRRAILRNPDRRWLHLPLAVKCAELLCSHSGLLHLGSNGNTTGFSLVVGGGGAAGGGGGVSGGNGDALLAAVLSAARGTGAASGFGGLVGGGGTGHTPLVLLRGGMLRLFGRLFRVVCRMTLRSAPALEAIINLTDDFLRRVDRGQRSSGFLHLKRAVSADDAHEHSPLAVTMTIVYNIHELLLRRLHAAEYGGSPTYPNANAALVDRMKSMVEIFRYSFEQLPAFAIATQAPSPRQRHETSAAARRQSRSLLLGDITGEVYVAGVSTLQWLSDHQANPRRTVEAFAEVASRTDYNAFLERCLIAVEREQTTDKALAADLVQEQRWVLRRLQELFGENSLSRRRVQESIEAVMVSSGCAGKDTGWAEGGSVCDGVSTTEESEDASFASFFLPSAVRKVTAAARAATWARFTMALRGTVWNLETAGPQQRGNSATPIKYVKLSSQEQQALAHRKLVYDRDGTNYRGLAMTSYSSPTSPASESTSVMLAGSLGADTTFGDDVTEVDMSFSATGSNSRASRLRLRGGEAVLLQMAEDDDAAAEEDLLRLSAEEQMRSFAAAPLSEYSIRDTSAFDQLRRSPAAAAAAAAAVPYNPTTQSVLSLSCEVPYMMHCWSANFTVRGSEVFVLIDDENKSYNQVVSMDAKPYILRPRTFSFHLSHVTQIAPGRRFRMRRTALEVWTRDRRSYFVNFADAATMNAALQALRTGGAPRYPFMTPAFLGNTSSSGGGGRHTIYVLQENPRREPMRLRAMALWRSRLLTNFDYLLVLNLLAGRTLNDMTQYPVFPWILADYTSSELDLTNPATFRNLSQPMGACGSEDRRAMVRERYTEMKDLGDVPSHYFTHYSSPAVTLYFLIRLPPYTTLSILLQGGHFDHADRMFHSVQATYKGVTTSTQDVRELIPELFYLPELCVNANRVDFGRRQDRTPMDDLQLPPWAQNDPYTFTYRMREALESPYVSAHLHEWIDLIFGYKQRGKDAIDALNVFNWHSYEELDRNRDAGSVDHQLLIDSLDNIGQTPIQLFRQPHLSRPVHEWADPLHLPTHVKVLPLRWGCVRVAKAVVLASDKVLVVTGNGAAASLRMHLNPIRQSVVVPSATSFANASSLGAAGHPLSKSPELHRTLTRSPEGAMPSVLGGGGGNGNGSRLLHSGPSLTPGGSALSSVGRPSLNGVDAGSFDVSEEYERRIAPVPAGVIPNNSPYADGSSTSTTVALLCYDNEVFLALGGLFDNSVVIRALSGASGDIRLRAHHGRVAFVVRSGDSRYLVTGAEDTTFAVWSCQLQLNRQQLDVELLFTIYGHEDMPSAADVSSTLDLVATASMDGVLMLHSLSTGSLDRVIRHPHNAPIHRVLVQTSCYVPNLIFFSHQDECVHQYSINGAALRTFRAPGRITAWCGTSSQYFLIACQPHPYVHGAASPTNQAQCSSLEKRETSAQHAATAPCILYVHSFFLEVVKTVWVPADHVVSSLSAHPSHPQVVVAGTENGRLLLLRSTTV